MVVIGSEVFQCSTSANVLWQLPGMGPESWLSRRNKVCKLLKLANEDGIEPLSWNGAKEFIFIKLENGWSDCPKKKGLDHLDSYFARQALGGTLAVLFLQEWIHLTGFEQGEFRELADLRRDCAEKSIDAKVYLLEIRQRRERKYMEVTFYTIARKIDSENAVALAMDSKPTAWTLFTSGRDRP
ncbi:hypothetical protein GQ457_07G023540 [Hibiscus cannabinus]